MDKTQLEELANSPLTVAGFVATGLMQGLKGVHRGIIPEELVIMGLMGSIRTIESHFKGTLTEHHGYMEYVMDVAVRMQRQANNEGGPVDGLARAKVEGTA